MCFLCFFHRSVRRLCQGRLCCSRLFIASLAFIRFYKLHVTSLRFAHAVWLHRCVRRLAVSLWDKTVRLYGSLYIPYWDIKAMGESTRGYECNLWSCISIVDTFEKAGFSCYCEDEGNTVTQQVMYDRTLRQRDDTLRMESTFSPEYDQC